MLHALWLYRGFLFSSVKRDFRSRYLQSLLGSLWNVVHPAALVLVYTLVFANVMSARLPGASDPLAYGIYLCAGLFAWNYFAEIVARLQNVFLESANLLKKSSFPRICLPVATLLSATVNFTIIFTLFLVFLAATGRFPGALVLAALPVLLLQTGFAFGLGILTGTLNVFLRDIGQAMAILLQFWFWLTPVVYPIGVLPAAVRDVLGWNPMYGAVKAYQDIFVTQVMPDYSTLWPLATLTLVLLVIGYFAFRRLAPDVIDEL